MAKFRKKQRVMMLVFGGVALALSTILVSLATRDSIVFFFGPSELMAKEAAGEISPSRRLRVGGMVVVGSEVVDGETRTFRVTDMESEVPVTFTGIPPSLFKEGQGVVAEGTYANGIFTAETILAKHDEKYVPREVQDIMRDASTSEDGSLKYSPGS